MNGSSPLNVRTALLLCAVCQQTYKQYANEDGLFLVPDGYRMTAELQGSSYDDLTERFGFVLESEHAAIAAFRGTSSSGDWISDLIARQRNYPPIGGAGLTHTGFTDIYMTLRGQLLDAVAALPPGKPLFVTGHSLGGALATLAAPDIAVNGGRTPIVYTFGAPRTGDYEFARSFNRTIAHAHRIVNESDIVPHVPPIIYKSPKTEKIYYYVHTKGRYPLSKTLDSVSANHSAETYFHALAELDPVFAQTVCSNPPGFCHVSSVV